MGKFENPKESLKNCWLTQDFRRNSRRFPTHVEQKPIICQQHEENKKWSFELDLIAQKIGKPYDNRFKSYDRFRDG